MVVVESGVIVVSYLLTHLLSEESLLAERVIASGKTVKSSAMRVTLASHDVLPPQVKNHQSRLSHATGLRSSIAGNDFIIVVVIFTIEIAVTQFPHIGVIDKTI